ncbi:MAG: hypothetical protein PWQ62_1219 [Candidatus Methanomethylophilaceae archaeon]|nr:hypothetical protein [Candidatus Methanomethylophilaceae archaeon]
MPSGKETLEKLREEVGRRFTIYEIRVLPEGALFVVGASTGSLEDDFEALRLNLRQMGFVATIMHSNGKLHIGIVKTPPISTRSVKINQIMLLITFFTTAVSGSLLWSSYVGSPGIFRLENLLYGALYFAVPLLLILGTHELSHFLVSHKHGLNASLPFFIPSIPPIGTFGAFISIREPIPNRKALLDIGLAGPLGGFLVAVPMLFIGFHLTATGAVPVAENIAGMTSVSLGFPIIMDVVSILFPSIQGMYIHPTLFAAWLGLFVTGINLLPAGQLDGGHIARAALGEKSSYLAIISVIGLLSMSIYYPGWLIFAFLIFLLGVVHPPPLNDITPLDKRRKWMAIGALVLFLLCFTPIPIKAG